jgi:hypothetical protein
VLTLPGGLRPSRRPDEPSHTQTLLCQGRWPSPLVVFNVQKTNDPHSGPGVFDTAVGVPAGEVPACSSAFYIGSEVGEAESDVWVGSDCDSVEADVDVLLPPRRSMPSKRCRSTSISSPEEDHTRRRAALHETEVDRPRRAIQVPNTKNTRDGRRSASNEHQVKLALEGLSAYFGLQDIECSAGRAILAIGFRSRMADILREHGEGPVISACRTLRDILENAGAFDVD